MEVSARYWVQKVLQGSGLHILRTTCQLGMALVIR